LADVPAHFAAGHEAVQDVHPMVQGGSNYLVYLGHGFIGQVLTAQADYAGGYAGLADRAVYHVAHLSITFNAMMFLWLWSIQEIR
jgi:hypothetical protein